MTAKALLRIVVIVLVLMAGATGLLVAMFVPVSHVPRRAEQAASVPPQPIIKAEVLVDKDYVLTLTTADRFLQAWASRDAAAGYALLTERLKQSRSEAELMQGISGLSNPHHQAYEITEGNRRDKDTFQFSVWTYEYYTGEQVPIGPRPQAGKLVLKRQADGQWLVDELP